MTWEQRVAAAEKAVDAGDAEAAIKYLGKSGQQEPAGVGAAPIANQGVDDLKRREQRVMYRVARLKNDDALATRWAQQLFVSSELRKLGRLEDADRDIWADVMKHERITPPDGRYGDNGSARNTWSVSGGIILGYLEKDAAANRDLTMMTGQYLLAAYGRKGYFNERLNVVLKLYPRDDPRVLKAATMVVWNERFSSEKRQAALAILGGTPGFMRSIKAEYGEKAPQTAECLAGWATACAGALDRWREGRAGCTECDAIDATNRTGRCGHPWCPPAEVAKGDLFLDDAIPSAEAALEILGGGSGADNDKLYADTVVRVAAWCLYDHRDALAQQYTLQAVAALTAGKPVVRWATFDCALRLARDVYMPQKRFEEAVAVLSAVDALRPALAATNVRRVEQPKVMAAAYTALAKQAEANRWHQVELAESRSVADATAAELQQERQQQASAAAKSAAYERKATMRDFDQKVGGYMGALGADLVCPNCKHQVAPSATQCPNCGVSLK